MNLCVLSLTRTTGSYTRRHHWLTRRTYQTDFSDVLLQSNHAADNSSIVNDGNHHQQLVIQLWVLNINNYLLMMIISINDTAITTSVPVVTLHCCSLQSEPCGLPVVQHSVSEGGRVCQIEESLRQSKNIQFNIQNYKNWSHHNLRLHTV